jgi:four helix bundle protein
MTYVDWAKSVPPEITGDAVWRVESYRLSLFAADLAWTDVSKLVQDRRTISLADQLYRSAGAVSSDIVEGYSRSSHKDQARFYEYALGSAREARNWYYEGRHVLGQLVCAHRLQLLTQVIRLLLTMIPNERALVLKDEPADYQFAPAFLEMVVPMP